MAKAMWVLIAAAREPGHLERTLDSIVAAEKPAAYRGVLVVENGPRKGMEARVKSYPADYGFRHLYVPEANKSHALNCGLAELEDTLVVMTDDDVRLDAKVLKAYDEAARGSQRGEFYGGRVEIEAPHGSPPAWMRRFYPLTIAEAWGLPYEQPTQLPGQTFMGTNWAAFARDLIECGGFDPRLGPGGTSGAAGQETEAQRRLMGIGATPVYVPAAAAWHELHAEFLDSEWVLRRAYKHALEWGIRRARERQPLGQLVLRGVIGRLNAHLKGLCLRLAGGDQRRFAAAFHAAKWRGRWDGIWLGRRWHELPTFESPLTATAREARRGRPGHRSASLLQDRGQAAERDAA
jgi:glycosyltransferase involved in cell wall biosynthesis